MADLCQKAIEAADLADATGVFPTSAVCEHPTRCSVDACHAAGHEHDSYGPEEWGCAEGCPCTPACDLAPVPVT